MLQKRQNGIGGNSECCQICSYFWWLEVCTKNLAVCQDTTNYNDIRTRKINGQL